MMTVCSCYTQFVFFYSILLLIFIPCPPLALFVVAGIGLERTAYTMSSTAETVEVCLNVSRPAISCPITFPFDIFFNLITSAGSL